MFAPRLTDLLLLHVNLVGKAGTTSPIRLSFDDQSKAKVISKIAQYTGPSIYVPLKVAVDPNRIVTIDRVVLTLTSENGHRLYRDTVSLASHQVNDQLGTSVDAANNGHKTNYQAINLPGEVFAKLKNTTGRLSLTYLMRSYAPATTIQATLPFGVPQKVAGFGVCETRLNPFNDQLVDLYCFPATDSAKCIAATVLNPAGALIGTPQIKCSASSRWSGPDTAALTGAGRFVLQLPAANGAGIRPLTLTTYRAVGAYIQTVVLPQVKLADLTGLTGS